MTTNKTRSGRPKRSTRDDQTVKIDRALVSRGKLIAAERGIPLAELLSNLLEGPLNRAFLDMAKRLEKTADAD